MQPAQWSGAEVRRRARAGEWTGPTPGLALGHVQANLVVVPRELAFDFLLFCHRNPKPCPLLDVTEPGSPEPRLAAAGSDLRTDLPCYRVWRHGQLLEEPADLRGWWTPDSVAFLLGCSFTCGTSSRGATCRCIAPTSRASPPASSAGRWLCRCGR
jgi:uncharacterized protein YcsI (UPF0317 family)